MSEGLLACQVAGGRVSDACGFVYWRGGIPAQAAGAVWSQVGGCRKESNKVLAEEMSIVFAEHVGELRNIMEG